MRKVIVLALPLVAALLAVSGCSKESGTSAEGKRYTIAVIPKGTVHEFWKTVHAGAQKAADELEGLAEQLLAARDRGIRVVGMVGCPEPDEGGAHVAGKFH